MPDETKTDAQEAPETAPAEVSTDALASEPAPEAAPDTQETAPTETETPATQETPEVTPVVEQDGGETLGYRVQQ